MTVDLGLIDSICCIIIPDHGQKLQKTLLLFSRYAFVLQTTRVHFDVLSVSVNSPILIATYNW